MKAVIMAGGQGTRFWPLSRQSRPKQFLNLTGEASLFRQTVDRLLPVVEPKDIFVVSSGPYVSLIRQQAPELCEDQIIVEPAARNTAPCIGFSALWLSRLCPDDVMAVLPADHSIRDQLEFHALLRDAEVLARQKWLVTFGIEPDYPATGYGYLERGSAIEYAGRPAYRVLRFAEKPDLAVARRFVDSGDYYWNSGMFVWSIPEILEQIDRHMPRLSGTLKAIGESWEDADRVYELFREVDKVSIDYGVMEKAERVASIPCRLGWNDVGSWSALREVQEAGGDGIVAGQPYIAVDSSQCVLHSEQQKLVALVGVRNLVVVETDDVLLICAEDRAQEVREVVARLDERGRRDLL